MRLCIVSCCLMLVPLHRLQAQAPELTEQKQQLIQLVEERTEQDWQAAKKIWEFAEPGYQEQKSSKVLIGLLEEAGFTLEKGVAGIPTAFIATATVGESTYDLRFDPPVPDVIAGDPRGAAVLIPPPA